MLLPAVTATLLTVGAVGTFAVGWLLPRLAHAFSTAETA